ncbi:MAG: hypothetical protein ACYC6P_07720 [Ignavibacteriaceae bacterium]
MNNTKKNITSEIAAVTTSGHCVVITNSLSYTSLDIILWISIIISVLGIIILG